MTGTPVGPEPSPDDPAAAWGRQQYTLPLPVVDALITATARVHGMTLVTRNVQDFEPTGVQVLNRCSALTGRG
jgi:toxin FitB